MPSKKDELYKKFQDFLDEQESESETSLKNLSDRIYNLARSYTQNEEKLNQVLDLIKDSLNQRQQNISRYENELDRLNKLLKLGKESLIEYNDEIRNGIKIDNEQLENTKRLISDTQKRIQDIKRAKAINNLSSDTALDEADNAFISKWQGKLTSGEITQEQFDIRMTSRFKDYKSTSGATFEEYRQKQLSRADTVINIAEGSGVTGLSGVADMGISALSKAGPYAAIAAAVLKVVKAGVENILSRMDAAYQLLKSSFNESNELVGKMKGDIDTRLQGLQSDLNFEEITKTLFSTAYNSAVLNQKAYIENISKLVESGVAYNLEERAMLMTMSDRIATTFDALDKSLTRLIKLQQADLTASQLGSEASLIAFLNSQFNDTSYMSDLYDNTSATLLEATSQMNIDQATSFMYAVQKWLGSLYALGMSQEAVGTIAQGLSYISTGNINALNNNQGMQTLFAMATENAGMSYSSMLTQGLDAEMVDTLMLSMVNYLGEIAKNTSNQVVKSQWADILNMTVSDLRAVSNLTEADMAAISTQGNLGYIGALTEVQRQLQDEYIGRMSTQELIENVLENALFQRGMQLALDPQEVKEYLLEEFARQFEGNGSVIEDVGHWLQQLFRQASTNTTSIFDFNDAYDVIQSIIDPMAGMTTTSAQQAEAALKAMGIGYTPVSVTDPDAYNSQVAYAQQLRQGLLNAQLKQLQLTSWGGATWNNRGSDFTGLTTAGVGSLGDLIWAMTDSTPYRTSVSRSSTVYTSAADSITKGFDAVESSATAITSANEEVTDQMEKLYNMLFESQSVPIKVFIEGYSDDFKEDSEELLEKINDELADRLEIALSNSSNSVYSMISTIQGLKGV